MMRLILALLFSACATSAPPPVAVDGRIPRCQAGDGKTCLTLAYAAQGEIPADPQRTAALFEAACKGGAGDGCLEAAWMFAQGAGVVASTSKAQDLYGRACELAVARGCTNYARMLEGRGSQTQVRSLYDIACEHGDAKACGRLAAILPPNQSAQALVLHKRACDGSFATSCRALAKLQRDRARSAALYRKACDLGDSAACHELDALLRQPSGVHAPAFSVR